jgi:hypothetical protein
LAKNAEGVGGKEFQAEEVTALSGAGHCDDARAFPNEW